MFYGENLANLRMMNGMSRKELSNRLDITEQAVWQYENNYTSPKLQTLNKLRAMFNVKSKYFYTKDVLQKDHVVNRIDVTHIAYRSKMLHAIFKTRAEAKHLQFLDLFIDELTSFMTYPTRKIVQLRDRIINYLNTTDDPRDVQIEVCAKVARESLGLGNDTNNNLLFLIEKSGVFLFEKKMGEEIDAYSLWTIQNKPYIILGNKKRSAVRRNFDIAHELGHLLLHYRLEFSNMDGSDHKRLEKEANTFACAFLLPADIFTTDLKAIGRVTNPDAYIDLKEKWLVSLQVLGYRAANLGIIETKQHRSFYAALHRRGYLQWEPMDDGLRIQRPMKVKTMIEFASKNNLIDLPHMVERQWKVEMSFISQLTGVELTFLDQYMPSHDITHTDVAHLSAYHQ